MLAGGIIEEMANDYTAQGVQDFATALSRATGSWEGRVQVDEKRRL
jgi:hypothetical protein